MLSAGKGNLVHCKRHEAVSDVQAVSYSVGMPVRGEQQPAVQQQTQHAQPCPASSSYSLRQLGCLALPFNSLTLTRCYALPPHHALQEHV